MLAKWLRWCGQHGRWVLPSGLIAGLLLPALAKPLQAAIPACIAVLLFLAVVRLYPNLKSQEFRISGLYQLRDPVVWVLLAQCLTPAVLLMLGALLDIPVVVLLAACLVAAAPPISGSPNLVLLLKGDANFALKVLITGTAILPISCVPILYFLFPEQSSISVAIASLSLLLLILLSVACAFAYCRRVGSVNKQPHPEAIDGASALVLAVMVIGLLSAVHEPDTRLVDIGLMLLLAVGVNLGLQAIGVLLSIALKRPGVRTIASGVLFGNRNIALFLSALPSDQMQPLLLFIACYQVPMYLTPLVGARFYRHLE